MFLLLTAVLFAAAPIVAGLPDGGLVDGGTVDAGAAQATEEELRFLSVAELRLIRNEIFARHGHVFDSADLKSYFGAYAWYKPRGKVVESELTELERAKIALIKKLEGATPAAPLLFPVVVRGQWGYIDATGQMKVEPAFEQADEFFEDRAFFKNGEWGVIGPVGEVIIPARFTNFTHFHEGRAAVESGHRWGYVDRLGQPVVAPKYAAASAFSEGLAAVQVAKDGIWGYVDRKGEMVIAPSFRWASDFSEGLAAVKSDSDRWEVIDRHGKRVLPPSYGDGCLWDSTPRFVEGLAGVVVDDCNAAFIDRTGKVVLSFDRRYTQLLPFGNGRAAVGVDVSNGGNGLQMGPVYEWSIIDRKGKTIVRFPCTTRDEQVTSPVGPGSETFTVRRCDSVESVHNDWIRVRREGGGTAFLDRSGKVALSFSGLSVDDFRGPLAKTETSETKGHGYVDRKGEIVWRMQH